MKAIPAKSRPFPNKSRSQPRQSHEAWSCRVYAIELDPTVIEDPAYQAKNPCYVPGMPHYYIGATSLEITERVQQHLSGHKNASRIANLYGRQLCSDVLPNRRPKRRTLAFKDEKSDAWRLRKQGYGVWQA